METRRDLEEGGVNMTEEVILFFAKHWLLALFCFVGSIVSLGSLYMALVGLTKLAFTLFYRLAEK